MAVLSPDDKGFWLKGIRQITNKGVKKNIGTFPSIKMGRNIWFESILECDYTHLLEFDWDVVKYKEQPFRLSYIYEGKRRTYVPDFFVQRRRKFQVIEVKPEVKATIAANLLRYRIISSILNLQGYEFIVATERQIRVEPLLENVKILWRYARTTILPLHQVYCNEYLSKVKEASLLQLADALGPRGMTLQILYSLLYWGVLTVDLHRPVDPESTVRFASESIGRCVPKENNLS